MAICRWLYLLKFLNRLLRVSHPGSQPADGPLGFRVMSSPPGGRNATVFADARWPLRRPTLSAPRRAAPDHRGCGSDRARRRRHAPRLPNTSILSGSRNANGNWVPTLRTSSTPAVNVERARRVCGHTWNRPRASQHQVAAAARDMLRSARVGIEIDGAAVLECDSFTLADTVS